MVIIAYQSYVLYLMTLLKHILNRIRMKKKRSVTEDEHEGQDIEGVSHGVSYTVVELHEPLLD